MIGDELGLFDLRIERIHKISESSLFARGSRPVISDKPDNPAESDEVLVIRRPCLSTVEQRNIRRPAMYSSAEVGSGVRRGRCPLIDRRCK